MPNNLASPVKDSLTKDNFTQNNEYHVASFVAHAIATNLNDVQIAINQLNNAEIHATSPEGKIVFTLEGKSQRAIGKDIDKLKLHKGLLNLSPVYHQYIDE